MLPRHRTTFVVAAVISTIVTAAGAGHAQTATPRDAEPRCALGTVRMDDGLCRTVRHVPVVLEYAGADRWNVWRAIQMGGRNRGYEIVEASEAATADTRAVGRMRVAVAPRGVAITAELRGARGLSTRCTGPRVVAAASDTSRVFLGALLVQSGQSLTRCFDELWTTAAVTGRR
jgi:hypothetical protein